MTAAEARRTTRRRWTCSPARAADQVSALTMTYADEAIGIVRAAADVGVLVVVSFTVETDGRLPSGQPLREAVEQVDAETGATRPTSWSTARTRLTSWTCSTPPAPWLERIHGVRANASKMSHAELDEAEELDEGDPAELARGYRQLQERLPNLDVAGGCCGTDQRHVRADQCDALPVSDLRAPYRAFMEEHVYPNEAALAREDDDGGRAGRRSAREGEGRRALGAASSARGRRHGRGLPLLRAPERGDRPLRLGAARLQLPGAGRGQRRDPPPVRHGRPEGALPRAARRGRDAVVLLYDRARGLRRRPDRAADDRAARRRRVGDRRAQVVLVGRRGRRLRDRHGRHRAGRRAAPADEPDPRPGGRARDSRSSRCR